jgi:threonine/homoserine/homoserine lactone efflux protein
MGGLTHLAFVDQHGVMSSAVMSLDVLLALASFAFVGSVTPGPNNVMLLASGLNYGIRRSLPHAFGISLGFGAMVVIVALGMGQVFRAYPQIETGLTVIGAVYMLYLAWQIAQAGEVAEGEAGARPMTFLEAAAFQWVNPKAWVLAVTAAVAFVPVQWPVIGALIVGVVFILVNLPSISIWLAFGAGLRRFLADPAKRRVFNWTMAALLVASLWPMVRPLLP